MTSSWRWFIHPETAISMNRNGSRTLCVFKVHYRDHRAAVGNHRRFTQIQFSDHTRLSCAAGAAAWAVMLLSVSIVNVFMVVLLGWEAPWRPRSRSSMADRGRQPDVVAFQTLRPQLVLLDGGAGVVAPMAFRDLARLADSDRHPYRAVAAAGVHRHQDRQSQLGVVLDRDRESGRRRRLALLRDPCHLLVSLHDHSLL